MQYILMLYVNEAGWPKLTKAQQEQGMAAYMAYTEALREAGIFKGTNCLRQVRLRRLAPVDASRRCSTALSGLERTVRRLLRHRRTRSRCRDLMGRPLPAAGHGVVEVRPLAS